MQGSMQTRPLMISSIIQHAARNHAETEIVSARWTASIHRTTYAADRAAHAPPGAGAAAARRRRGGPGRHAGLERVPPPGAVLRRAGMGAIYHTINPRLASDDIAYIVDDAGDAVLFAETSFVALLDALAPRIPPCAHIVMMTDARAHARGARWPPAWTLHCYETLMARRTRTSPGPSSTSDRRRALLHLRHHRASRRACCTATVPPCCTPTPVDRPDVFGLRAARPGAAGGADVPRQRLGHALRGADGRRRDDHARPPPGRRQPDRADERRAGDHVRRRADHLARPAAAPARQRRTARHRDAPGDRRLRVPADADRGVRDASTASASTTPGA